MSISKKREINPEAYYYHLAYLDHKLNPTNNYDFTDSSWYDWLHRIQDGESAEIRSRIPTDFEEDLVDIYAEDFENAKQLSWYMYGSLIVARWSQLEKFFKQIQQLISFYKGNKNHFEKWNFKKFKDFITKNIPEELNFLENIDHYHTVNFIRILNNVFKHNKGVYTEHPNNEENNIPPNLALEYNVNVSDIMEDSEKKNFNKYKISYEEINYKKLIIHSSIFCKKLSEKVTTLSEI